MKTTRRIDSRSRGVYGVAAVLASLAAAGVLAAVGLAEDGAPGATTTVTTTTAGTTTVVPKVVVCHKTHSKKKPRHTISISQSAWPAHQKHGDTLGACTAPTTGTTTAGTTTTAPATPAASPGKSGEPHGKSGVNGKGHG